MVVNGVALDVREFASLQSAAQEAECVTWGITWPCPGGGRVNMDWVDGPSSMFAAGRIFVTDYGGYEDPVWTMLRRFMGAPFYGPGTLLPPWWTDFSPPLPPARGRLP